MFAAGRFDELFYFPWFRAWEFVVGALAELVRFPWYCQERPLRKNRWEQCEVAREEVIAYQGTYRQSVLKASRLNQ
jgi:hypothetical protein